MRSPSGSEVIRFGDYGGCATWREIKMAAALIRIGEKRVAFFQRYC
jgi:hypothetical protein